MTDNRANGDIVFQFSPRATQTASKHLIAQELLLPL